MLPVFFAAQTGCACWEKEELLEHVDYEVQTVSSIEYREGCGRMKCEWLGQKGSDEI